MSWAQLMDSLYAVEATLAGPWLLAALLGMGLAVGMLTGLFGVGGAFMITPLLANLLRIDYSLAVGSSMSFTLGSSSAGWVRHMRLGNVARKTMLILAGSAVCGTIIGADIHTALRTHFGKHDFSLIMDVLFIALLALVAFLVLKGTSREREETCLLQRVSIPPYIRIRVAHIRGISLPGLCVVGILMGMCKGVMGIGGGVIFMPMLLLVVGLSMHQSVGTSLGVVLCSSLAGVVIYGAKGDASLWIVFPLLVGSAAGIQVGTFLCERLQASRLRRYFAFVVIAVALYLSINFIFKVQR
ncbi:MAG: TSUP family transporter [Planctomycetes bacterium]|jgi:uncharacterized membrane protein YfcA|nr:sulfite exporter TauE/SafE family protein [Phycisphaerae bacterium]NBB96249.1 TSUP family transporter [Planctomycetota bacterium]